MQSFYYYRYIFLYLLLCRNHDTKTLKNFINGELVDSRGKDTIHMVKQEEGKPDGATIISDGSKATRIGAAYANAEIGHLPGLWDQFRMITHPGVSLIPAAIVNAELERSTGKQLITALAADKKLC